MEKSIYVCGPSHIHQEYTDIIKHELINKTLFNNCILNGIRGLPNWSNIIIDSFSLNAKSNLVWIVSDYKFNNFDYPTIFKMQSSADLFLNVVGYPGNVDRAFMEPHHIEVLGNHTLKVIDYIIDKFPHIKLLFWCLYKRTKVNTNSSYPSHLWYDSIKEKYKSHMIDIDDFTTPADFASLLRDEGGHPNKNAYILMDKMICATFGKK